MSNCSHTVNILTGIILMGVVGLTVMCFFVSSNLKAEINQIEVRKNEKINDDKKRENLNP